MNIIVNSDDFGGSEELNLCVQQLHELGVLSSATLISNSPFFENAVKIAKNLPELGIGIHLTLDGPFNVLNAPSSIINPESKHFYDCHKVVKRLRYFGFRSEDIYNEYNAQIQKVLDQGIKITHIDHHHHLHLYFQSLNQVKRVAQKYRIKCVRSQVLLMPSHQQFFNSIYRKFHQYYIKNSHFTIPDGYLEFLPHEKDPYLFNLGRIEQLLKSNLSTFEIETHPKHNSYFDTIFLKDTGFINLIKKHSIINYNALKTE